MPSTEDQHDRYVVPRLRSFAASINRAELSSLRPLPANPFTDEMLLGAIADWENSSGISVACDLVSLAVTTGKTELAKDAAKFLLSTPATPTAARRLAMLCLGQRAPT